jgi:hypothetical protein
METQFFCKNERRRDVIRNQNPKSINGIDYLEVVSQDQKTLNLFFIHPLPGEIGQVPPIATALTKENIVIEGGVRVRDIHVQQISRSGNILTVTVDQTGDFSTYTLRIITSSTHIDPPPGFDPQLSSVNFSFKVDCPSEFDCKTEAVCPPEQLQTPLIDYLAKDYASFRRLMLDRMSVIIPTLRERTPADLQIALVELMAYLGDTLSYYQDAVATEAYLGTARRRISLRRHARLLDYNLHDGCNARVWVFLEVGGDAENQAIPAGTMLFTRGNDETIIVASSDLDKVLIEQPIVFETMHSLTLHSVHNKISFYTWSDSECCLPLGATRATLLNDPSLLLEIGDLLIFEEVISPTTGIAADADPNHRHAVRLKNVTVSSDPIDNTSVMEIEWYEEDALPFPLCLTALIINANEVPEIAQISVARGNIVLADHGRTLSGESLSPELVESEGNYRPFLRHTDITFRVDYDDEEARHASAFEALAQETHDALPAVTLDDGNDDWTAKRDLLGSDRFAPEFVVEIERDGSAQLRFGDDVLGKKPSAGSVLSPIYRIGNGKTGNVGAEAIGRILLDFNGISKVRNPLPAKGGTDAETMEEVRQFAPQAFRTQERAVTEADWAMVAERHQEVQKASARFRWTGSWYTVFITIDRKGGHEVDAAFEEEIRAYLERYRIAGYDLEVNGPIFVPLDISMTVCVKPNYFRSDLKKRLLEVFSCLDLPSGERGFFHPDNLTFGQPIYLSQIYKEAMNLAGIASVEVILFQRWGKTSNQEIENGVLTLDALEIIRLDNDANFPENGKIDFVMMGGV